MIQRPAIDVSDLSPYSDGPTAPLWWGMAGMIAIELTVFSTLIASYFYLKTHNTSWPPGGIPDPKLVLPTINTVILVGSSFVVHWADKGITRDDVRRLRVGMLISILLALGFVTLKIVEYSDVPYGVDTHAYGSIVWTIVSFHTAHVLSLVLKTVVVTTLAWRGYFSSTRRLGVTINGLYWHFVVAVWLPLYFVLYWSPRL